VTSWEHLAAVLQEFYSDMGRNLFLHHIHGTHPASYPRGTGDYFPVGETAEAWSWLLYSF